jgi:hypothetical protein
VFLSDFSFILFHNILGQILLGLLVLGHGRVHHGHGLIYISHKRLLISFF